MAHQGDSYEQRSAEPLIRRAVSVAVGVELAPRSLRLDGGARVDVDGVAPDESVFVEIFAHQGRLKGAQFHKVARDALKLITGIATAERTMRGWLHRHDAMSRVGYLQRWVDDVFG